MQPRFRLDQFVLTLAVIIPTCILALPHHIMASCFDSILSLVLPTQTVMLNGREYSVISRLGAGGFAVVELIEANHDNRQFALKRINLHSQEARMLGELELTMLRKLDHPCIVHLHGSARVRSKDNTHDELLLLLDFFPRGSLQNHIETTHQANIKSSALWIMQVFTNICEGVEQIHSLDPPMAHRDIKPDNVMLGRDSQAILIDFGSCVVAHRVITDRTTLQEVIEGSERMCTPAFRAPELWDRGIDDGVTIDERIDIWALGCLLFNTMFGMNPFDMAVLSGGNLKLAIIDGKFSFPSVHNYPQEMCDLISYMLNPDEKSRPFIGDVLKKARQVMINI